MAIPALLLVILRSGRYSPNWRAWATSLSDFTLLLAGAAVPLTLALGSAYAAEVGNARFWNLTGETIVHLSMAPTGSGHWGPDQCRNDPDGAVDFDERLKITGISSGRYDVRFTQKSGRSCIVTDVEVKTGSVFAIDKEALARCSRQ